MKISYGVASLALLLILPFQALQAQRPEPRDEAPDEAMEERREHAISALPERVREAVRGVAPDLVLQDAESFWERDYRVYEIRGRLLREVWYVTVRSDGRVLNVRSDFVGD